MVWKKGTNTLARFSQLWRKNEAQGGVWKASCAYLSTQMRFCRNDFLLYFDAIRAEIQIRRLSFGRLKFIGSKKGTSTLAHFPTIWRKNEVQA